MRGGGIRICLGGDCGPLHGDEEGARGVESGLWAAGTELGHGSWKDSQALQWGWAEVSGPGTGRAGDKKAHSGTSPVATCEAMGSGSEARACWVSKYVWD